MSALNFEESPPNIVSVEIQSVSSVWVSRSSASRERVYQRRCEGVGWGWGRLVKFKQKYNKLRGPLKEFPDVVLANDNVSFFCSKAFGIKRKRIPSMQAFCGMAF